MQQRLSQRGPSTVGEGAGAVLTSRTDQKQTVCPQLKVKVNISWLLYLERVWFLTLDGN
jgi:hypothetical protein